MLSAHMPDALLPFCSIPPNSDGYPVAYVEHVPTVPIYINKSIASHCFGINCTYVVHVSVPIYINKLIASHCCGINRDGIN